MALRVVHLVVVFLVVVLPAGSLHLRTRKVPAWRRSTKKHTPPSLLQSFGSSLRRTPTILLAWKNNDFSVLLCKGLCLSDVSHVPCSCHRNLSNWWAWWTGGKTLGYFFLGFFTTLFLLTECSLCTGTTMTNSRQSQHHSERMNDKWQTGRRNDKYILNKNNRKLQITLILKEMDSFMSRSTGPQVE